MAFQIVITNFDRGRKLEIAQEIALDISVEEVLEQLDNLPYKTVRIDDREDAEKYAEVLKSLGADAKISSSEYIEESDSRSRTDGETASRIPWRKTPWGRNFIRAWPIVLVILVAISLVTPCGISMFMVAADPHGTPGVGIFIGNRSGGQAVSSIA